MSNGKSGGMSAGRRLEVAVYSVLGVAMTLLMFGNSVMRYVFGSSIVWSEEIIRLFFVLAMFIAITGGFIRNEHIGFDSLSRIPGAFNTIHRVATGLCLIVVGGMLAFYGGRFTLMTGDVPLPATNLSTSLFMWPGVVAGAVWVAIGAWHLVTILAGRSAGRRP
ncbi:MAG: TRAP transporter small permease subunit [Candidatus Accumulibacter sp.]|jgi:TRAP-type C4-dicarboxylate transport system permease small subunit|nr:TRAP transporter small permease subunit [Accumulibacter sp.]